MIFRAEFQDKKGQPCGSATFGAVDATEAFVTAKLFRSLFKGAEGAFRLSQVKDKFPPNPQIKLTLES